MSRRSLSVELAVGVLGAAFIVALAWMIVSAAPVVAQPAPVPPACAGPDQIGTFYAPANSVAYPYRDAEAQAVLAVVTMIAGPPPGNPAVTVYVALDLDDMSTDLFLYDAAGCATAHMGPIDIGTMTMILEQAGVAVPFGATYYQLPGIKA